LKAHHMIIPFESVSVEYLSEFSRIIRSFLFGPIRFSKQKSEITE
jgi:hypothetical protein